MKIKVTDLDIYPASRIRFSYDVEELKEDIRQHGQLQPGRVVYRDSKPFVYIGVRRFLALKQLYGESEDEKFLYYEAEVDTIASDEEIVERAVAENSGPSMGSTIRVGITPLEIVFLARKYDFIAMYVPKKHSQVLQIPVEAIEGLAKIQTESKYVFSFALLHELAGLESSGEIVFAAGSIARGRADEKFWSFILRRAADEYRTMLNGKSAETYQENAGVQNIQETSPQSVHGSEMTAPMWKPSAGDAGKESQSFQEEGLQSTNQSSEVNRAEGQEKILESRQVVEISCPNCGYMSPMSVKGSLFSVEFVNRGTDEMEKVDADNVLRTERMCPKCEKLMYITIKVENMKELKYRISVSRDADPKVIEIPAEYPTLEYLGWTGRGWVRIGAFGRAVGDYPFG